MKVLVAGSRGYCGIGIVQALRSNGCQVVGFDISRPDDPTGDPDHVELQGDILDLDFIFQAIEGCQAVIDAVIYRPGDPSVKAQELHLPEVGSLDMNNILTYQINVGGTLNLLEAARQRGVSHAVLLSSARVVWDYFVRPNGMVIDPGFQVNAQTPLKFSDMYGLSKHLQELVGQSYATEYELSVIVFRPWWVVDGSSDTNRFGKSLSDDSVPLSPAGMVDRIDLGDACYQALQLRNINYAVYYPLAGPSHESYFDVEPLRRDLGWQPVFTFPHLARTP